MKPRAGALLLLVAAGFLSACATRKGVELPVIDDWEARKAVLSETDEWEFGGRIAVRAADDGFNGKLWWRQDGLAFRARVSGPLGVGTIFINGDRGELTLTDRDGVVTELSDAEAELRQRYGWTTPLTSLRLWALGIPDPAVPAEVQLGAGGLLKHREQRGWAVTIDQYTQGGGQDMPRRVTVVENDIRVRLIIDDWTFR